MTCSGTESVLLDCRGRPLGLAECNHDQIAGVQCGGELSSCYDFCVGSNLLIVLSTVHTSFVGIPNKNHQCFIALVALVKCLGNKGYLLFWGFVIHHSTIILTKSKCVVLYGSSMAMCWVVIGSNFE